MNAGDRAQLINKIVSCVADYRENEIPRVDSTRVTAWLEQFEENDQPVVLAETERMLSKTYISRASAKSFIDALVMSKKVTGDDPAAFWRSAGFLRLQSASQSQGDMLVLLEEVLADKFQLNTSSQDSTASVYIYLDDLSFSGNQIKNDLLNWAKEKNIREATVYVIVIGLYTYGAYYVTRELKKEFDGRKINFKIWRKLRLEIAPYTSKIQKYFGRHTFRMSPTSNSGKPRSPLIRTILGHDLLTERQAQLYSRPNRVGKE